MTEETILELLEEENFIVSKSFSTKRKMFLIGTAPEHDGVALVVVEKENGNIITMGLFRDEVNELIHTLEKLNRQETDCCCGWATNVVYACRPGRCPDLKKEKP